MNALLDQCSSKKTHKKHKHHVLFFFIKFDLVFNDDYILHGKSLFMFCGVCTVLVSFCHT